MAFAVTSILTSVLMQVINYAAVNYEQMAFLATDIEVRNAVPIIAGFAAGYLFRETAPPAIESK